MDIPRITIEKTRTYHYADGSTITFNDVVGLRVTTHGFHCLERDTKDKHIVAPGWRYITIDTDEWSR